MTAIQNDKVLKIDTTASSATSSGIKPKELVKDFDKMLRQKMQGTSGGEVSEEDLFAALINERISATKGEEAEKAFDTALTSAKSSHRSIEDAAKAALKQLRDTKVLSSEEADQIYSASFAAAQLDTNKEALFDSIGGANDPTKAVANIEAALLGARTMLEGFVSGKSTLDQRSLDEDTWRPGKTSSAAAGGHSGEVGGSAGFLYKPISDSDSKLAVLSPSEMTGKIAKAELIGLDGKVIETGRYTGNGNGGREHFRFNKPGGDYPNGLTVQFTMTDGKLVKYEIEKSSERKEDGAK